MDPTEDSGSSSYSAGEKTELLSARGMSVEWSREPLKINRRVLLRVCAP